MGDDVPVTAFLGGRLSLRQPSRGHRAGTDAVLVAAFAGPAPDDHIIDVGSGVGTIGLSMALAEPAARVTLLEREPDLAALARDNAAVNGLAGRVSVVQGDVFAPHRDLQGAGTLVVSNPPFYAAATVRVSPDERKGRAHVLQTANHGDWLRAMLRLAAPHARLVLVHRPDVVPALCAAAQGRLGALRLCPVLPRAGGDAIRVIVGGIKGSRAPLTIMAPLVLHDDAGEFIPQVAAMHRGEAAVRLFAVATRKSRPRGPASSTIDMG